MKSGPPAEVPQTTITDASEEIEAEPPRVMSELSPRTAHPFAGAAFHLYTDVSAPSLPLTTTFSPSAEMSTVIAEPGLSSPTKSDSDPSMVHPVFHWYTLTSLLDDSDPGIPTTTVYPSADNLTDAPAFLFTKVPIISSTPPSCTHISPSHL